MLKSTLFSVSYAGLCVTQGINSHLDETQAAVLRHKLQFMEDWTRKRSELVQCYDAELAGLPLQRPEIKPKSQASHHLYVVQLDERDKLRKHFESNGIGTQLHYPTPLHRQPAYREQFKGSGVYSNAERACDRILSLPLYPELGTEEITVVCKTVKQCYRGN